MRTDTMACMIFEKMWICSIYWPTLIYRDLKRLSPYCFHIQIWWECSLGWILKSLIIGCSLSFGSSCWKLFFLSFPQLWLVAVVRFTHYWQNQMYRISSVWSWWFSDVVDTTSLAAGRQSVDLLICTPLLGRWGVLCDCSFPRHLRCMKLRGDGQTSLFLSVMQGKKEKSLPIVSCWLKKALKGAWETAGVDTLCQFMIGVWGSVKQLVMLVLSRTPLKECRPDYVCLWPVFIFNFLYKLWWPWGQSSVVKFISEVVSHPYLL